jgi:hypothetical protein
LLPPEQTDRCRSNPRRDPADRRQCELVDHPDLIRLIIVGASQTSVLDPTPEIVVLLDNNRALERVYPQFAQLGSAIAVSSILYASASVWSGMADMIARHFQAPSWRRYGTFLCSEHSDGAMEFSDVMLRSEIASGDRI